MALRKPKALRRKAHVVVYSKTGEKVLYPKGQAHRIKKSKTLFDNPPKAKEKP